MQIEEITWEDAGVSMKRFTKDNASNRKGLYTLKTVGYLVHEDDKRVVLAMQECVDSRDEVRHVAWIPKSGIIERNALKVGKK